MDISFNAGKNYGMKIEATSNDGLRLITNGGYVTIKSAHFYNIGACQFQVQPWVF